MFHWHIITGEYPPQLGGVSDYTRLVACELVKAGDEVHIWAPEYRQPDVPELGIRIHRLPGRFGPRALATMDRAIARGNSDNLLVQYVPHAFGFKAMNLPFSYWLYARRRWNTTVMFHEVAFQRRIVQPIRHNVLGEVTSLMAMLVARSAKRVFVSCLSWEGMLRHLVRGRKIIQWLPVPSSVPLVGNLGMTKAVREKHAADGLLVGHFGTYGRKICQYLEVALPELLRDPRVSVMLLGREGGSFRDALALRNPATKARLSATGALPSEDVSVHLSACDLMVQPYPDGISARRTSAMAALAHGRSVVTTIGDLTEPLWAESGAVATVPAEDVSALARLALRLCDSPEQRSRLGLAAATLYRERFDMRHTIQALRAEDADCNRKLVEP